MGSELLGKVGRMLLTGWTFRPAATGSIALVLVNMLCFALIMHCCYVTEKSDSHGTSDDFWLKVHMYWVWARSSTNNDWSSNMTYWYFTAWRHFRNFSFYTQSQWHITVLMLSTIHTWHWESDKSRPSRECLGLHLYSVVWVGLPGLVFYWYWLACGT